MNKPLATNPRTGRTWPDSSMCQIQIDSKVYSINKLFPAHPWVDWCLRTKVYINNNNKSTTLYLPTNNQVTPSQTQPKLNLDSQCNTPSAGKSLISPSSTGPDSSGCLPSFHLTSPERTRSSCLALFLCNLFFASSRLVSSLRKCPRQFNLTLPYSKPDPTRISNHLAYQETSAQTPFICKERVNGVTPSSSYFGSYRK